MKTKIQSLSVFVLAFIACAPLLFSCGGGSNESGNEGENEILREEIALKVDPGGELGCPSVITVKGIVCHTAGDAPGAGIKFEDECKKIYSCASSTPACQLTVKINNVAQSNRTCQGGVEYDCTAEVKCEQ